MINLEQLITNSYFISFLGGMVFYFTTVFFFLDKVSKRLENIKRRHDNNIKRRYYKKRLGAREFINIFDSLNEQRTEHKTKKEVLTSVHQTGIAFLVGAILGGIFESGGITQDLPIGIMAITFILFFINLIHLALWYHKQKR